MRSIVNNKTHLFIACLFVGLVTLLAHSLRVEIKSKPKANTEQASGSSQASVFITPSAAVTVNFFTLHVDGFLEISPVFQTVKKVFKAVPEFHKATASFHQTLFRFIIAPNAP
jgi:hypothetical protein